MELLTSPEVAHILGKSARTVQRMADAGALPVAKKLPGPNGAYLFDRAVIEAHAEPTEAACNREAQRRRSQRAAS